MSEIKDILSFIKEELQRIEQRQRERPPLYRLSEGENIITVLLTENWRKLNTQFGERVAIPVLDKFGKRYTLMISPNSKLYTLLLRRLGEAIVSSHGNCNTVTLNITKIGKGLKASYEVNIVKYE